MQDIRIKQQQALAERIKAEGWEVADDSGAIVAVTTRENYEEDQKKLGKIIKELKYNYSWGIKIGEKKDKTD